MYSVKLIALIIANLFGFNDGLVFHVQMKAEGQICTGPHGPLTMMKFKEDPKVCGGIMCHNSKGDALIYYCQKTLPFLDCPSADVVQTSTPFPQCCWSCCHAKDCFFNAPRGGGAVLDDLNKEEDEPINDENNENDAQPDGRLKNYENKESATKSADQLEIDEIKETDATTEDQPIIDEKM